jgi:hypothetical protein
MPELILNQRAPMRRPHVYHNGVLYLACNRCKVLKPRGAFYRVLNAPYCVGWTCRQCTRAYARKVQKQKAKRRKLALPF